MSILRRKGKRKLRFRVMDKKFVTTKDFKYFKEFFLECLRENSDIETQLNTYYKIIQVGFFYEKSDPHALTSIQEFFKDPNFPRSEISSSPAFAVSKNGLAYIGFYLRDLRRHFKERKLEQNIAEYSKNVVFEELCHLVEQRGSYGAHPYPESWITLLNLYDRNNRKELGEQILLKLHRDRGEYEVRRLMSKKYPKEWVERFWRYFMKETPLIYEQNYEQWKKEVPEDIAYGRLITDILRAISVLCVAEKVPKEALSDNQKKQLDTLIETGKLHIMKKKSLIKRDMVSSALRIVESLDENIFETSETFFSTILDVWKRLGLLS